MYKKTTIIIIFVLFIAPIQLAQATNNLKPHQINFSNNFISQINQQQTAYTILSDLAEISHHRRIVRGIAKIVLGAGTTIFLGYFEYVVRDVLSEEYAINTIPWISIIIGGGICVSGILDLLIPTEAEVEYDKSSQLPVEEREQYSVIALRRLANNARFRRIANGLTHIGIGSVLLIWGNFLPPYERYLYALSDIGIGFAALFIPSEEENAWQHYLEITGTTERLNTLSLSLSLTAPLPNL